MSIEDERTRQPDRFAVGLPGIGERADLVEVGVSWCDLLWLRLIC